MEGALDLATADDLDLAAIGPIFERLCGRLGHSLPTHDDAIRLVTGSILREIASGACDPEAGLEVLMRDVVGPHVREHETGTYVGESFALQHLIGAHYGYDDLRERPTELSVDGEFGPAALARQNQHVIAYARDWLRTH